MVDPPIECGVVDAQLFGVELNEAPEVGAEIEGEHWVNALGVLEDGERSAGLEASVEPGVDMYGEGYAGEAPGSGHGGVRVGGYDVTGIGTPAGAGV
jgi:hypothetical protein